MNDMRILKGILSKGFIPSYCLERIPDSGKHREVKIAMVSFCDVPLSEVKDKISSYGGFGIGMTMQWGRDNHLNPVQYLESQSFVAESVLRTARFMVNRQDEIADKFDLDVDKKAVNDSAVAVAKIVCNSKPYKGELIRGGKVVQEEYKFYDEREWRYLPFNDLETGANRHPMYVISERFENHLKRYPTKPHLPDYAVKFKAQHIKYIIVPSDNEVHELLNILKDQEGLGTPREVELLYTRILTMARIKADF